MSHPGISVTVHEPRRSLTHGERLMRASRLILEQEARRLFPFDLYAQQCHVSGYDPLPAVFEIVDDAANVPPDR